jgi:hypothetical protein
MDRPTLTREPSRTFEAPLRSRGRRFVTAVAVVVVAGVLLFLFLWPLAHFEAGAVSTQRATQPIGYGQAELPSGEQVSVSWEVVGGGPVQFQVASDTNEVCNQYGNGSSCSFITPHGGTYAIWVMPLDQSYSVVDTVTYSLSYYAPLL